LSAPSRLSRGGGRKDRGDVHRTALYRTLELREASLAAAKRHAGNSLEQLLRYIELELTAEPNIRIDPIGGRGLKAPARERYLKALDKQTLAVSELVARGVSEGSILPCDPYLRAVAIDSILNRLIDVDTMMLGATMTRGDVITGIIDALRHGILLRNRSMPSLPTDQREITALLDLDLDLDDIEGRELRCRREHALRIRRPRCRYRACGKQQLTTTRLPEPAFM
jgi:hypothetical protein